jgi:hypothetical protein
LKKYWYSPLVTCVKELLLTTAPGDKNEGVLSTPLVFVKLDFAKLEAKEKIRSRAIEKLSTTRAIFVFMTLYFVVINV